MTQLLALTVVLVPTLAFAQGEAAAPPLGSPVVEPTHTTPIPAELPKWSLGAGFGYVIGGSAFYPGTLAGMPGFYSSSTSAPSIGVLTAPRMTVLLERRVSERLFVTFQIAASYGESQDELNSELNAHQLSLDGELGVRRVLNPHGIVEVSWFGSAGVGYTNAENRSQFTSYDPRDSTNITTSLQTTRGHTFAVGALTGLTLERELVEGLSLRLSSSLFAISYGLSSSSTTSEPRVADGADRKSHEFDLGLRFSPSIELRYQF